MGVDRRTLTGAVLAGVVVVAGLVTSPERLLEASRTLSGRPVALGALLVGLYLVRPFLGWPPTALAVGVGAVLGPAAGVPVALAGTVGSALLPFYLGEWFRTEEGPVARLSAGSRAFFERAGDVRGVTAARLAPVPADAVSVAAGLSELSPGAYVVGTLLGELPWTVAAVVVGASARTVATGGLGALTAPLLAATALASLALLAGPLYRAVADGPAAD